jgi:hypothetical protein
MADSIRITPAIVGSTFIDIMAILPTGEVLDLVFVVERPPGVVNGDGVLEGAVVTEGAGEALVARFRVDAAVLVARLCLKALKVY